MNEQLEHDEFAYLADIADAMGLGRLRYEMTDEQLADLAFRVRHRKRMADTRQGLEAILKTPNPNNERNVELAYDDAMKVV